MADSLHHAPDAQTGFFASKLWHFVILLLLGVFWGLSFSLARMSTENQMHPLSINLWAIIVSTIGLAIFCLATGRRVPLQKHYVILYVICGLLGSVIPGTLYFYAASKVSAGVLSITVATVPLTTFLGAAAFRIETPSLARVLGVVLGIVSISLLVAPRTSLPDPSAAFWVVVMVLGAGCYAIENLVIAARMPANADIYAVVFGMFVAATLMMLPVIWIAGAFEGLPWPLTRPALAIIGMGLITATAYGGFYYLVVHAGPVFASQCAYLVTLAGVLWGIAIYGESHSAWVWASLATMIIALILVQPRRPARSR